jgi:hypothetical protein
MAPERKPAAPATRDAALRRVSHARRWLIGGAVALTGVFSAVASQAFPGHTLKKATTTPAAAPVPAATPTPTPAQAPAATGGEQDQGSGASAIAPPDQAPQPSNGRDGAVSGGS